MKILIQIIILKSALITEGKFIETLGLIEIETLLFYNKFE
jgi:hypothetical protein